jgi:glycosyltransferase involved in cell wall biosynthesis
LKVLHLLNSAAGGAAVSTTLLMEGLRKRGIPSCAVCHPSGTDAEKRQVAEAARGEVLFTPLYWWNRKTRAALWKRPLLQLMQLPGTGWGMLSGRRVLAFALQRKATLIHTNTILNPEGGTVARTLGLPHVWHLRERLGPGQPFRLPVEGAAFGRYMARNASVVVANSEGTAELVQSWLTPEQLAVVPNGVDLTRFRRQRRPGTTAGSSKVMVAMVANLTSRVKRHALFIDAAARVAETLPVEFRLYGHDPIQSGGRDRYAADLHAQVERLGLGARFQFSGFVADPAALMAEIDVLVHPTEVESFGRVVVEAMATGLPVVGVRGGGVAEQIVAGETGLLVPPGDAAAMASAVETLVADEALRQRLGKAGRRRAEARYSIEAHVEAIVTLYERARPPGR